MHTRRFPNHPKILVVMAACAALVGGFFLASAVFGGGPPNVSEYPRPLDPSPSSYVVLTPGDDGFSEFLREFPDFAVYWVGQEFRGHALRSVVRNVFSPEDGSPTENMVMFLYGSCGADKLTEGGCPFPLSIIIQPYCLKPPARIAQAPDLSPVTKIRGDADAATAGGGLRIWTGDVSVKIYAASPQLLEDATNAMTSPNGLGVAGIGGRLPDPAPDCADYEWVPYS